jgi:Winged helix-turn-helix DNA-binding
MTENSWSLMNSHGIVLFYVAANPDSTMREMSTAVNLTERRVSQIIRDLVDSELLTVTRIGRRNGYSVNSHASFIHPTLSHITLGQFETLLQQKPPVKDAAPEGPDDASDDTVVALHS